MTFREIWKRICKGRPQAVPDDEPVNWKAGDLRRALRKVYELGRDAEREKNMLIEELFKR